MSYKIDVPDSSTFLIIERDKDGLIHMTNTDILLVSLLDASNPESKRLAPQLGTDQFLSDLKQRSESLSVDYRATRHSREIGVVL